MEASRSTSFSFMQNISLFISFIFSRKIVGGVTDHPSDSIMSASLNPGKNQGKKKQIWICIACSDSPPFNARNEIVNFAGPENAEDKLSLYQQCTHENELDFGGRCEKQQQTAINARSNNWNDLIQIETPIFRSVRMCAALEPTANTYLKIITTAANCSPAIPAAAAAVAAKCSVCTYCKLKLCSACASISRFSIDGAAVPRATRCQRNSAWCTFSMFYPRLVRLTCKYVRNHIV